MGGEWVLGGMEAETWRECRGGSIGRMGGAGRSCVSVRVGDCDAITLP